MKKKLQNLKKLFFLVAFAGLSMNGQNSLHFDGANDHVKTTYPGVLGDGARSVEAWIKRPDNASGQQIITEYGGGSGSSARFTFKISNNLLILESGGSNSITGTTFLFAETWYHFVAVYDPTATPKAKMYINGVLEASGDIAVNTTNTVAVTVGARGSNGFGPFKGNIDEFRFWDKALSQAEIQQNMNLDYCEANTNLKVYFKFENGLAGETNTNLNTVADLSGNNNNGILTNFALTGDFSNWDNGKHVGLDNQVVKQNTTLTASQMDASYQWFFCGSEANVLIPGANGASFLVTEAGSYVVEITKNGCTALSDCIEVTADALGTTNFEMNKAIRLYPNPVANNFSVQLGEVYDEVNVSLINTTGQVIMQKNFANTNEVTFDISAQSAGVYFVNVQTNSGKPTVLKLVKK